MGYETEPAEKSLDKIRIIPVHKFESIQNWWPWLVVIIILFMGIKDSLTIEHFLKPQEKLLTSDNRIGIHIEIGYFIIISILLGSVFYWNRKQTNQIDLLYRKRAFDGIEFSSSGLCFDIKAISGLVQDWMIKNKKPCYALEWKDVKSIVFLPPMNIGETTSTATLEINLNSREASATKDLKKYLQKYSNDENGIWIERKHLVGYENAIISLLKNHTKVEIDIQDVLK